MIARVHFEDRRRAVEALAQLPLYMERRQDGLKQTSKLLASGRDQRDRETFMASGGNPNSPDRRGT